MMAWATGHGLTMDGGGFPLAATILVFLVAQRLGELVYARRNTRRLMHAGAQEYGRSHYPFMVAIHGAFLVALIIFTAPHSPVLWPLLIAFAALQLLRLWVLATLGPYWTTRIISAPGLPSVSRGPFRVLKHPNYAVVTAEIAVIPLMFGHLWVAVLFSTLNAVILIVRIRAENRALLERRSEQRGST